MPPALIATRAHKSKPINKTIVSSVAKKRTYFEKNNWESAPDSPAIVTI